MSPARTILSLLSALATVWATTVAADDDRSRYNQRAAETYVALFKSLDLDTDASVSRLEARGDLNFVPYFDDMDVNRDGIVTIQELQRYIQMRYGIQVDPSSPR